jgi:hypothetical protein
MIATPKQALMIWTVSWGGFANSMYAIQLEQFDLSFASFCVFVTSLLYWSEPKYNWIRTLDMTTVLLSLLYHMWRAYKARYYLYLYQSVGVVMIYPMSWYVYGYKKYWLSFYLHGLMHIIAYLTNMNFYQYLSR